MTRFDGERILESFNESHSGFMLMDAKTILKVLRFYARFTPDYTKIGFFLRKLGWPKTPPLDFSGQHWLITGASSGLGKAMMKAAAEAGASVVAISSNQSKLDDAVAEIDSSARDLVITKVADLSLQSGTEEILSDLLQGGYKFDVVQNNVGLLFNELIVTSEGRETTYAVNILSHYILTKGLVEGGAVNKGAAIINMTSGGMYNAPLSATGLNNTDSETYNGKMSYAFAKRAQVALADHWNDVYGETGISFYATHPGWTKTPGVKEALPTFWIIQRPILREPLQGCDTALWLCAVRPPIQPEVVWFDRKARPTHIFEFTKSPQCTIEELVEYFENDISRSHAGYDN